MSRIKGKKHQQLSLNPLYFIFYNPDNSRKYWISYYTDMKFEILMFENVWIMTGSSENQTKHDLLKEFIICSPKINSVISKFIYSIPMSEIFSLEKERSRHDIFVKFKPFNMISSRFEKIRPEHGRLAFNFLDEKSHNLFVWQNKFSKIELMKIDLEWVAAYTPKTAASSSNTHHSILVSDEQKDKAFKKLMSQIIQQNRSSIIQPNRNFIDYKSKPVNKIDSGSDLTKKYDFLFEFKKDNFEESWTWQNEFCKIEISQNGLLWTAKHTPSTRITEECLILKTIEHQTKEDALTDVLKKITVTMMFRTPNLIPISIIDYFNKIEIKWIIPEPKRIISTASRPKDGSTPNNCPWQKYTSKCDGSRECSYCASSGTAYFMRSDD